MLDDSPDKELLWGIDLGGSKVEGAVIDRSNNDILFRERIPTEASKGYSNVLGQIISLVKKMEKVIDRDALHVGIGTPGIIDPQTGKLKNSSNAICLNGKPVKADLAHQLNIKVEMANDAHCFAIAETRHGVVSKQYPEASVVFGIIMGTGVGGGLVINDRLIYGRHGIGGEWGHNFLDKSGYRCFCGKTGCVEKVISGPALEQFYSDKSGTERSLKEIVDRANKGEDDIAVKTLQRLTQFFGRAVATLVNIIDPDVIVLGGGVSNIDCLYTEGRQQVQSHIFNDQFTTPILRPTLGDAAGVIGAAYLTSLT